MGRRRRSEEKFSRANLLGVRKVVKTSSSLRRTVYKSGTGTRGRGHRDASVGTWNLGTRDEGLKDIKYGTRGRQMQGRRGRGM